MGGCGSKSTLPQDHKAGTTPNADKEKTGAAKPVDTQGKNSEYKLTYFPLLARGFAPALCLEEHGFDWKGKTETFDTWPALKESGVCPFGQLPILETPDAGVVGQSTAILKYVGHVKNAAGEGVKEQFTSDMLIGLSEDFINELAKTQPSILAKEKGTAEELEAMWGTSFVNRLGHLEKLADGKDRFTAAGNSVGELTLFTTLHQMVLVKPDFLDAHPNVKAYHKRVLDLPSTQKVLTGKSPIGELGQFFISN